MPYLYDLYDLYDLSAAVAGCEPYDLHDLAHVSWVGSIPCTDHVLSHNGRL